MTPEELAEKLMRQFLDRGIDVDTAHESDHAQGMPYDDIDLAIDIANRALAGLDVTNIVR